MVNYIGKKVIVRANRAGVFYGELISKDGQEVCLKNFRKLHYWKGAAAVEQIAEEGVKNQEECRFTMVVKEGVISEAIQIIPCSDAAISNLESVKVWKK